MEKDIDKTKRKVLEALYIAVNKNINQRTGDVKWCMTSAAYTWAERIKRRGGHWDLAHLGAARLTLPEPDLTCDLTLHVSVYIYSSVS